MFSSIWEDIKWKYQSGNMLIRIIMINVAVFVFINLIGLFLPPETYKPFSYFWMISTDWWHNLTHPWVFITHMFLHESFWHIFWNMLLLYWFGNIVGDLTGDRVVLPTYLLSGLVGGAVFFLMGNLPTPWNIGNYALGASAAVNGFMMLAAAKFPNYTMNLILLGPVRIKYIVAVFILIDVMALSGGNNSGGHFAHLGGAAMGWFIVYLWQEKSIDLVGWANGILDKIFTFFNGLYAPPSTTQTKTKIRVDYDSSSSKTSRYQKKKTSFSDSGMTHQEQLDLILDKIKESGYDNLTDEEKEFLYNASKK